MSQFDGWWRIVWMEEWDSEYIDMVEPGHFTFAGHGGHFVFGTTTGEIDSRQSDGGKHLEFSWEGQCEGDQMSGRGWLEMKTADTAEGRLFMHLGDESGIKLEKI